MSNFTIPHKRIESGDINSEGVNSQFARLHHRRPAARKRIEDNISALKINLLLETVRMFIPKILYELRNEFAFIGMKPMDVFRRFGFLVLVERQRPVQVLSEPLLVIDLSGTVVRLIVPQEFVLRNLRCTVGFPLFDATVLHQIRNVRSRNVLADVSRCPLTRLLDG